MTKKTTPSGISTYDVLPGLEWLYDDSPIPDPHGRAQRCIDFIRLLKHSKSRLPGQAIQLDPWQERIIRRIYGPSDEFGNRLVQRVFLQVGKGSRKTSLSAILALLHIVGPERTNSGQGFIVAHAKENAEQGFNEIADIIQTTQQLDAVMKVTRSRLRVRHPKSGSYFHVLSSDVERSHSITPSFVIIDELWAHKKTGTYESMKLAVTKSDNPLMIITTTAGRGKESPDYAEYEMMKAVAAGEVDKPRFLPIIFEADENDPIDDPRTWHKVLPGLRFGYPNLAQVKEWAEDAVRRPSERPAFEQFYLGRRQSGSLSPFIPDHVFARGEQAIKLEEFLGEPAWIGLDCSTTRDLTGLVVAFRRGDEYHCAAWGFCPAENIHERSERDRVEYERWAHEGWIIPAGKSAIDYSTVEAKIRELIGSFDVKEIACDIKFAQPIVGPLMQDGHEVVSLQQGWVTQSPALNVLEKAVYDDKLKWDSPVLAWCMGNVTIHNVDSSGNRLMHKGKSRDRIDLASALWMAVSRASAGDTTNWLADPNLDVSKFFADLRK